MTTLPFATALLLFPLVAGATVYRCEVDGRVTFSDRPCIYVLPQPLVISRPLAGKTEAGAERGGRRDLVPTATSGADAPRPALAVVR